MAWFQEMKLKEFSLLSSLSHYNVKNGDQTVVLTASRCPDILTTSSRWIHLMWQNYRRKIWELVIYFAESIHFQSAFLQSQCLKEMENLDWLLLKKYLGARVPSPIIWCQIRSLRKLILTVCNLFFLFFFFHFGTENRTRSKTLSQGGECSSKLIQDYLKSRGVGPIIVTGRHKAASVERVQKTLQQKIYTFMNEKQTKSFINVLPDLVFTYNSSRHSTTKW